MKNINDNDLNLMLDLADSMQPNLPGINCKGIAREFYQDEKGATSLMKYLMDLKSNPDFTRCDAHVDLSEKQIAEYDLRRGLKNLIEKKYEGLEFEVSQDVQRKVHRELPGTLTIPTNILDKKNRAQQNAGVALTGGNAVVQQYIPQSYNEFLINNLASTRAGAVLLSGVSGRIPMLKEVDEYNFSWYGESDTFNSSGVTWLREDIDPKIGGSLTSISRLLLLQSKDIFTQIIMRKLFTAVKKGIDFAYFYGDGDKQPLGLKNISGTHGIAGANYDRTKALTQRKAINTANADLGKSPSFVVSPSTLTTLLERPIIAGSDKFLVSNDQLVERQILDSNQITDGDLFYGAYSTSYVLEWGMLEVRFNPFKQAAWEENAVLLAVNTLVNFYFGYPEAFSIAEGVN